MNLLSEGFESVWWLLILIGVMIIIHELGHYWAARFFDVRVDTFSFGFGPRLFGVKVGETDFRFAAIPLGGYVKMAGEQVGEDGAADPRGFLSKPRWQRLIIAFAGPFMNVVLSVGLLAGLFMVHYERPPLPRNPVIGYIAPTGQAAKAGIQVGDRVVSVGGVENPTWEDVFLKEVDATNRTLSVIVERQGQRIPFEIPMPEDERTHIGFAGWDQQQQVLIADVTPGEPAERAGLKAGDILKSVNNRPVLSLASVAEAVQSAKGAPAEVVYERNSQEGKAIVTPVWRKVDPSLPERWVIGIKQDQKTEVIQLSFPEAMRESVKRNVGFAGLIYRQLRGLLEQRLSPKSLQGPVAIAREAKRVARLGLLQFVELMVAVSMNLAIFNLLPIPILDGGTILMLLIEMIRRQDLSLSMKENVLKAGFAFLISMVAFVLYNDISKVRADLQNEAKPAAVSRPAPAPTSPPAPVPAQK